MDEIIADAILEKLIIIKKDEVIPQTSVMVIKRSLNVTLNLLRTCPVPFPKNTLILFTPDVQQDQLLKAF